MDEPTPGDSKEIRVPLSRTPSYLQNAVPRRAIRSFENLVALANDQERLKDARKIVWRDRGEPAVELSTIRQCLEHALRGGSRKCRNVVACAYLNGLTPTVLPMKVLGCLRLAFAQALTCSCCYSAYYGCPGSSFCTVLLAAVFIPCREFRLSLIRHAILGEDSFRFAAMIGMFC